jgi:G:T-mismatch repair DNA endonuclease (very short patch repair protein)
VAALEAQDWSVLTIWECEMKDTDALARRLKAFLD